MRHTWEIELLEDEEEEQDEEDAGITSVARVADEID